MAPFEPRPGWLLLDRAKPGGGVRMRMVQLEGTDHSNASFWTPAAIPPQLPSPVTLREERHARKLREAARVVSEHVLQYADSVYGANPDWDVDELELRSRIEEYVVRTSEGCGWHALEE